MRTLKFVAAALAIFSVFSGLAQPPAADPHAQAPHPGRSSAVVGTSSPSTAQTCAACHANQVRTQPSTPMGRALELTGDNPTLKNHPLLTFHRGAYTYTIQTTGEKSTYTVTDGAQTISLPIQWSLGVGGQTWVLERNGKLYESLVSYYPAISGLDITTGDEILKPATLDEAMGREMSGDDSKACFGCHSTNVISNGKLSLQTLQPGVGCQHCHEGALIHASDANEGAFDTAPPKLSQLSSEKLSNFCGQCHRTWEMVVRNHWRGPANVRFQAYRLANSRCFDGTDPRISCLACHNPHQDVIRTPTGYDAKCLACHAPPIAVAAPAVVTAAGSSASGASAKPATLKSAYMDHNPATHEQAPREQAKVCPVAKSECVSCHMPKIVFPGGGGHLSFTDHQIRVVKPGETYPD